MNDSNRRAQRTPAKDTSSLSHFDQMNEQLKELQIREALDKQKLIETKKQNDKLKEELTGMKSYVSQLEKAREINQGFFGENDRNLTKLKKKINREASHYPGSGSKSDFETLITKIRELQEDHKESINYYLKAPPDVPVEEGADKLIKLLRDQINLFHQQLVQRQYAHEALHQRYYQSWLSVDSEIDSLVGDIRKLVGERKQDLQTIYKLERKKAMLEAGLNLQPESINAHELAMRVASKVIDNIQESDSQKALDGVSKRLQRKLMNKLIK